MTIVVLTSNQIAWWSTLRAGLVTAVVVQARHLIGTAKVRSTELLGELNAHRALPPPTERSQSRAPL